MKPNDRRPFHYPKRSGIVMALVIMSGRFNRYDRVTNVMLNSVLGGHTAAHTSDSFTRGINCTAGHKRNLPSHRLPVLVSVTPLANNNSPNPAPERSGGRKALFDLLLNSRVSEAGVGVTHHMVMLMADDVKRSVVSMDGHRDRRRGLAIATCCHSDYPYLNRHGLMIGKASNICLTYGVVDDCSKSAFAPT